MTMLIAWLVFPLVLALLSLGCGLLLGQAAALRLPAPLLLPAGFTVVSLTTQFAHLSDTTAELATPAVVALALVGYGLWFPWRPHLVDRWPVVTAVSVFLVFAAPVLLTSRATFLGYIKLDDTATYLEMLDRAMEHGYNAAGLAASTYEASLKSTYTPGYPLGSLQPLGVGGQLVGTDAAWLWQPYIAFLAVLIAVGLYQIVSGAIRLRPLRALVAFGGAQAALIYGYAMWGGIKELSTAAAAILLAGLVPLTVANHVRLRSVLPLAAASAAVLTILTVQGVVWIVVPVAVSAVLIWRSAGLMATARSAAAFLVSGAVLAIPAIAAAGPWLAQAALYRTDEEFANLLRRLSWIQVFGIWPHGDFRTPPASLDVTHVLVILVAVAAVVALVLAWRRRAGPELPVAATTAALACFVYVIEGSPWIGAKALATSSPIVVTLALAGAAMVFELGQRVEGGIAAGVVLAGVLWSNALQYHDVFLAPNARLSELESIGHRFAGQGPTLLTEFEVYGARHFLREMDTEAASELRRHYILLRTGDVAPTGVSPDVDEIQLAAVLSYPTLVVRQSGVASRPPSDYSLVSGGRYYQVWQRPDAPSRILEHLSLGSRLQPAAVPPCSEVMRLGRLAAAQNGLLATVQRPQAIVIQSDGTVGVPTSFGRYGEYQEGLRPYGRAAVDASFTTPSAGEYGVWVGGSFRARVEVLVDGRAIGSARSVLQWPANFVRLGDIRLTAGDHTFRLTYSGPDWRPGSGGQPPWALGPFAIAKGTQDMPVSYVQPADARSLCGRSLDWVEALRG